MGAVALAILAVGWAFVARLAPLPVPAGWAPATGWAEYTAVLHVHSRYSHDGRGSIEEIAEAAARAGARVVFLTDHNTLAPLAEGKEGWYGETLVLIGAEVTTGAGYLLLFSAPATARVKARGFAIDDLVEQYRADGGIVILAHPEHPRLGWRENVPPVDGVEVVDVFDQVINAPLGRQLMGLLAYPVNPVIAILSVVHWPRRALSLWDRIARERPVMGVLGLDAHGGIELTEEAGVRFPSHETAFRLGQLHFVGRQALVRDGTERQRVYRMLRAGQFFNAFDGLAPARGFRFEARGGGTVASMGEEVTFGPDLAFQLSVPPVGPALVRLLRGDEVVYERTGSGTVRVPVTGPGRYRVEVDLEINLFPIAARRRIPWIFSNAIDVRG